MNMLRERNPYVPKFWERRIPEHLRFLSEAVNGILNGALNNSAKVTLDPGATETELDAKAATMETIVVLTPMSASAAAAVGAGLVWATAEAGKVTIHHDADSADDRAFAVAIFG